ncbi:MAG: transcriptional regulator [Tepidiforma sp.]|nr:MAG: transcriptional regulator [Tepidiforma sp.]GIW56885.1 MAG: transcriptional regulator [Nitrospiraceae bacterium]
MPVEAVDVLAIPHFASLGEREAETVAPLLREVRLGSRELLMAEGDECGGFYFVRSGSVRLFRTGADGRQQTLRVASAGETFGEVPIFDGGPNPASVEALEEAEVILVPTSVAMVLVERYPAVARALLKHLAVRLRAFNELVEQLSLQTVQQRLARYLYLEARERGRATERGVELERRLSGEDLATLLGSVREVVARTMKGLESAGVIEVERHRYIVRDLEGLRRYL